MELKQIDYSKRIDFLIRFTTEIINNLEKEEKKKENIRVEKLKQKIILPPIYEEKKPEIKIQPLKKIEKISQAPPGYKSSIYNLNYEEPTDKSEIKIQPIIKENYLTKLPPPQKMAPPKQTLPQKPAPQMQPKTVLRKLPVIQQKPQQIPQKNTQQPNQLRPFASKESSMKTQIIQEIKPESRSKPQGFNLGKLEQLLKDPLIQSIECPGQGQNILIKKYNKIQGTKITLSQQEINDIITSFSMQAKIPVFGGILKAAVGDLIISAVVSEVIGSRFVINKIVSH